MNPRFCNRCGSELIFGFTSWLKCECYDKVPPPAKASVPDVRTPRQRLKDYGEIHDRAWMLRRGYPLESSTRGVISDNIDWAEWVDVQIHPRDGEPVFVWR